MRTVTKVTAIQFINGKCHVMKRKSRKAALSSYYACVSRDLLLMASGVGTHTHTDTRTKTISKTRHARLKAMCAWFNKRS